MTLGRNPTHVFEIALSDDVCCRRIDVKHVPGLRSARRDDPAIGADRHRPDVALEIAAAFGLRLDQLQLAVRSGAADELRRRLARASLPLPAEPDETRRVLRNVA